MTSINKSSEPRVKANQLNEVTVIIPSYNNSTTIEAAVRSALAQSEPANVIVVDDGSNDDTVQKVQALAIDNPRLSVLVQSHNQGPSAARNRAIAAACTPWIAILDGDDYMHPDRIGRMLKVGLAEEFDIIADDLIRIDAEPDPKSGTRLWSDTRIGLIRIGLARFARENINKYTGDRRELGYLKPLMRKSFLTEHDVSYNEKMRLAEDYDLYMRLLLAGARFGLIDPCGYYSIDYPNSLSKVYAAADLREVLDRDIEFLRHHQLSPAQRIAINEHKVLAHKQWAWMHLIEKVRDRNIVSAMRIFIAPPSVSAALLLRILKHGIGLDPLPKPSRGPGQRQRIGDLLGETP